MKLSSRVVGWTSWEAALCFSLPTWMLAARAAWPPNAPYRFVGTVLMASTVALLLCHILPAYIASRFRAPRHRALQVLLWLALAWFEIGAAASFFQLSRGIATTSLFPSAIQEPLLVAIVAVAVMILAWLVIRKGIRRQTLFAWAAGLFGFALLATSLIVQRSALGTHNPSLSSENFLGDNGSVFLSILLAAAPAAIFALRIGKEKPPHKTVFWSGVLGLWLPLACSVSLVSVAKVCGARLYWKPSLPIEALAAFAWLFQPSAILARFHLSWFPFVILLPPAFIALATVGLWLEPLAHRSTPGSKILLIAAGICGLILTLANEYAFPTYYLLWCRSILGASLLFGVGWFVTAAWQRFGAR